MKARLRLLLAVLALGVLTVPITGGQCADCLAVGDVCSQDSGCCSGICVPIEEGESRCATEG